VKPTQNRRYRHTVVLEFETTNAGMDDWSRALEPYTHNAARRFANREIRDNAGISDQSAFKILEHDVHELHTAKRATVTIVRRAVCADCERRRVCFRYRLRGHDDHWVCVEECASKAWDRGWRPVIEAAT
jgi:hypothetical protein